MGKKLGYTPVSIFAAGCGSVATTLALSNPATAPMAVGIGTAVSAVAGGIELNDEEKGIKKNLDAAVSSAWDNIDTLYRITYANDDCLSELKQEIMGNNTSVDEFVRNIETNGFEQSIAMVIYSIIVKHRDVLNRDPQITWDEEFTKNAAKEMASILVNAIKAVFEKVDFLRLLRAIDESTTTVIRELKTSEVRIIKEMRENQTLDGKMHEQIQKKIEHKKRTVLKQLLFPWFRNSPKYMDVFPELFIDPHFSIDGGNDVIIDVTPYFSQNLMILGDAGAGKSTFLRIWFAFKEKEKSKNKIVTDVLLFDAREYLMKESFLNDVIKYLRYEHEDRYLLLIDAIDEAFHNDYSNYKKFVMQLQELNNCNIWMGCRRDYYNQYSGGDDMALSDHDFYIQEWGPGEIKQFIKRYADIREVPDIPNRIEDMKKNMGEGDIIEELMGNPFQLSIIVFLAEDPEKRHIRGRYDLYEQFMTKWNKHEVLRGTSKYCEEEKEAALFEAALCIYCNKVYVYNEVAENDTGVSSLLRDPDVEQKWGDGHSVANEFYHRSLAEFILAKSTIKSMLNMNNPSYEDVFKRICKTKMKDDVTNFILNKFLTLDDEKKHIIKHNLQKLYEKLSETNDTLSLREQIIYYITRLDIDVSDFTGKVIDSNPKNNMIRLSLAYGCALLKDKKSKNYTLEYAKAIAENADGEEAITNRAWAVIYYGDFHGEEKGIDEYSYKDEEKGTWKKVRNNRIQRFKREKPRRKDLRFWILDIPLFHNFLIDRGWNDISYEEYGILNKLCFSSDIFDDDEKQFLIEEHKKLVTDYYNHLQA